MKNDLYRRGRYQTLLYVIYLFTSNTKNLLTTYTPTYAHIPFYIIRKVPIVDSFISDMFRLGRLSKVSGNCHCPLSLLWFHIFDNNDNNGICLIGLFNPCLPSDVRFKSDVFTNKPYVNSKVLLSTLREIYTRGHVVSTEVRNYGTRNTPDGTQTSVTSNPRDVVSEKGSEIWSL